LVQFYQQSNVTTSNDITQPFMEKVLTIVNPELENKEELNEIASTTMQLHSALENKQPISLPVHRSRTARRKMTRDMKKRQRKANNIKTSLATTTTTSSSSSQQQTRRRHPRSQRRRGDHP
jgi:hypothetical protein